MRHRRPAQRRQIDAFNALTKAGIAAENYPFCTIEPNVGHRRSAGSAARQAGGAGKAGKNRSGRRRVRRHRGTGRRRVEGRRPRQPVPGDHPRDRRDRARRALLRGRQRGARRGQSRSGRRHRDDQHRACAGRTSRPSSGSSPATARPPAPAATRRRSAWSPCSRNATQ